MKRPQPPPVPRLARQKSLSKDRVGVGLAHHRTLAGTTSLRRPVRRATLCKASKWAQRPRAASRRRRHPEGRSNARRAFGRLLRAPAWHPVLCRRVGRGSRRPTTRRRRIRDGNKVMMSAKWRYPKPPQKRQETHTRTPPTLQACSTGANTHRGAPRHRVPAGPHRISVTARPALPGGRVSGRFGRQRPARPSRGRTREPTVGAGAGRGV